MKTVARNFAAAVAFAALGAAAFGSLPVSAQDAAAVPQDFPVMPQSPEVQPTVDAASGIGISSSALDKKEGDPKVPESVSGLVKQLGTSSDKVNVEDMNRAREAVAKMDLLIDLEKRISELDQIRREREEKTIPAIPASALAPPQMGMMPPAAMQPPPPPIEKPQEDVVVERVVGARGNYRAIIRVGDSEKHVSVREGDKISDGSTVVSVNSYGITLAKSKGGDSSLSNCSESSDGKKSKKGKKSKSSCSSSSRDERVIRVKDVNTVFGSSK